MLVFDQVGDQNIAIRVEYVPDRYVVSMVDLDAEETLPTKFVYRDRDKAFEHAQRLLSAMNVQAEVSHG